MMRYVNAATEIAKKCGIEKMFKYIIGGLLFRKTRIIDKVFYELRSKNKVTYVNSLPAIKTYINMEIIGIESKIPIYVPAYDKGLSRDLLVYHGIREPVHIKVLYETIKNSGIRRVADIGSNIGYFPLIELYAGAKHIIAIEPVPDTFRYLKINLEDCPNCILMNAAIDLNETSKKIYVPLDENGYPMLNLASFNKD